MGKNKENVIFVELLKKHTNIDEDFIDTFFTDFKIGSELEFHIKDKDVAKYLGITLITLRKRLNNIFSIKKRFFENVDYIKIKTKTTSGVTYMLNYRCFENLAMSGDSEKSETVRMYFIKLREFLTENQHTIYQAVENKKDLGKYSSFESIYFIAVDDRNVDWKIGRTINIVQRLRNYNIGRIKEVDLKYLAIVKNSFLIEKCMKIKLKDNQVAKNKEIYRIEPKMIKQIVNECYCKYVSQEKNKELYEELGVLLGIYSYTKDKINIKPYVIIGKNL